jgi:hypothetical protein
MIRNGLMSIVLLASAPTLFAAELTLTASLPTGPCTAVAVAGPLGVAIGGGSLHTVDLADPQHPRLQGRIDGLGDTRQVALQGGIAYVASRIDGLFVIDLAAPAAPRLIAHYDTIEKATGIAAAGNSLFVACRYHGVEIIDIANPAQPRHRGVVLAGKEVQSVAWSAGKLYAGIWADREVAVVAVPEQGVARQVGTCALDGYGDGVAVRDGVCLAATGHHSRAFTKPHFLPPQPGDHGWGEGHGLEVINVANPAAPQVLGRLKTAPYYRGVPDFWSVVWGAGPRAVLCDAHNGVTVVDLADVRAPRALAAWKLPVPIGAEPEAAGGVAVAEGAMLVAGTTSGLHVLSSGDLIHPSSVEAASETTTPDAVAPAPVTGDTRTHVLPLAGMVRQILPLDADTVALAAGMDGIHLVALAPEPHLVATVPVVGFARHLSRRGDLLFVAEAHAGISIWRIAPGPRLEFVARHAESAGPVLQVESPGERPWLFAEAGVHTLRIIDVSDPLQPRPLLSEDGPGLFYGPQIAAQVFAGRFAAVFWNQGGPYWYDLGGATPRRTQDFPTQVNGGAAGGLVPRGNDQALVMTHDGYAEAVPGATTAFASLPRHRISGNGLNGLPTVSGDLLLVANPAWRLLRVIRLPEAGTPVAQPLELITEFHLDGHPGAAVVHGGLVLIPEGHSGLRWLPLSALHS